MSENFIKNFPYYLDKLIKDLPENKGVFLIIDDIIALFRKACNSWFKYFEVFITLHLTDILSCFSNFFKRKHIDNVG